jgi:hypothetical protein
MSIETGKGYESLAFAIKCQRLVLLWRVEIIEASLQRGTA